MKGRKRDMGEWHNGKQLEQLIRWECPSLNDLVKEMEGKTVRNIYYTLFSGSCEFYVSWHFQENKNKIVVYGDTGYTNKELDSIIYVLEGCGNGELKFDNNGREPVALYQKKPSLLVIANIIRDLDNMIGPDDGRNIHTTVDYVK